MKKNIRIIVYIVVTLLVAGFILNFFISNRIHQKVTQFLSDKVPAHIKISYQDLQVKSFQGSVKIDAPTVLIGNKQDTLIHTKLKATAIVIEDISYIDFLFNKGISVAQVKIIDPAYMHYRHKKALVGTEEDHPKNVSTKPISIEAFTIENGSVHIVENDEDESTVKVETVDITIHDIYVDKKTTGEYIPFQYESYSVASSDILLKSGNYETVSMQHLDIDSRTVTLANIQLKTKYSQEQLSQILPKERDHFNTTIDTVTIKDFDIQFKDSIPYLSASMLHLAKPNMAIYRDKLLPEDTTVKPLYSEMFRKMETQIAIDKATIENGTITYTEKIKEKNDGGTITLFNLRGTIDHLGNTYNADQKTTINLRSTFMKSTPLEITWQFDSSDPTDAFEFKGSIGTLASEDLNPFIQPNLNVKLDGILKETYFSIYGNNISSQIDMRMKYDNLEVTILEKNGFKVNKFLSSIVNLLIKNDTEKSANDFKNDTATADRDPTKSFFNYIWLSLKAGLLKIIAG